LSRKANGPEDPDTIVAVGDLAGSYFAAGKMEKGVQLIEEIVAVRRKTSGPSHPDTIPL